MGSRRSLSTSRKSLRASATPSSPSCTRQLVVLPVAPPVACLTLVVLLQVVLVLPQVPDPALDPPLRRSTKLQKYLGTSCCCFNQMCLSVHFSSVQFCFFNKCC